MLLRKKLIWYCYNKEIPLLPPKGQKTQEKWEDPKVTEKRKADWGGEKSQHQTQHWWLLLELFAGKWAQGWHGTTLHSEGRPQPGLNHAAFKNPAVETLYPVCAGQRAQEVGPGMTGRCYLRTRVSCEEACGPVLLCSIMWPPGPPLSPALCTQPLQRVAQSGTRMNKEPPQCVQRASNCVKRCSWKVSN